MANVRAGRRLVKQDESRGIRNPNLTLSRNRSRSGLARGRDWDSVGCANVHLIARSARLPAGRQERDRRMQMTILANLAFVFRASKYLRGLQVGVKVTLDRPALIRCQATREWVAPARYGPHSGALVVPEHFGDQADLPQVVQALGFARPLRPRESVGNSILARIEIIAITTSNSMSVKPFLFFM